MKIREIIVFLVFVSHINKNLCSSTIKLAIEKVIEASEIQCDYLILKNIDQKSVKSLWRHFQIELNGTRVKNSNQIIVIDGNISKVENIEEFEIPKKILITEIKSEQENKLVHS